MVNLNDKVVIHDEDDLWNIKWKPQGYVLAERSLDKMTGTVVEVGDGWVTVSLDWYTTLWVMLPIKCVEVDKEKIR